MIRSLQNQQDWILWLHLRRYHPRERVREREGRREGGRERDRCVINEYMMHGYAFYVSQHNTNCRLIINLHNILIVNLSCHFQDHLLSQFCTDWNKNNVQSMTTYIHSYQYFHGTEVTHGMWTRRYAAMGVPIANSWKVPS